VTAIAAALVLLATACSSTDGDGTGKGGTGKDDGPDDAAWAQSTDPVPARGLVWAEGSVVHLSDGTTIDTGSAMTTYVVAGDGVYFTPAASEDDVEHGNMTTGPLHFADRDGEVSDTGLTVYVESIGSSPDGRDHDVRHGAGAPDLAGAVDGRPQLPGPGVGLPLRDRGRRPAA
jgi:hypothetical protein